MSEKRQGDEFTGGATLPRDERNLWKALARMRAAVIRVSEWGPHPTDETHKEGALLAAEARAVLREFDLLHDVRKARRLRGERQ